MCFVCFFFFFPNLSSNQMKASAISAHPIKYNSIIYFSLTWSLLLKEHRVLMMPFMLYVFHLCHPLLCLLVFCFGSFLLWEVFCSASVVLGSKIQCLTSDFFPVICQLFLFL